MKSRGMLLVIAAMMLGAAPPALAQGDGDACPALVMEALVLVDEACAGLGRNLACYGHTRVEAAGWDEAPLAFVESGDTVEVGDLASLATFPLDVETGEWGVAVLALQADLPGTLPGQAPLPGQAVTFVVFGDVELVSEVTPEDMAAEPPPTCEAANTGTGSLNVRSGPGTGYAALGVLAAGETVTADGRNPAGDWLRFSQEGETGWVYAPLVTLDCAVDVLDMVEGEASAAAYTAPMQAFALTTGFGEPPCAEAPRDGLLVQAPRDVTVHFRINGVEVAVGSTGLLALQDGGAVQVSTFDGAIAVTAAGETQTVEPGYRVVAEAGVPPTEPQPYPYEEVLAVPVDLLPEPVSIPVTVASDAAWTDTGISVQAGQTLTFAASGAFNICSGGDPDICRDMYVGPDGRWGPGAEVQPEYGDQYPIPSAFVGALIGRIGAGEPFLIGEGARIVVAADGPLVLRVNDWRIEDNVGALVVQVRLE